MCEGVLYWLWKNPAGTHTTKQLVLQSLIGHHCGDKETMDNNNTARSTVATYLFLSAWVCKAVMALRRVDLLS